MLLSALKSYYVGHINKHIANVEIYLSRSTGIGEHSDIIETIELELEEMANYHDKLEMLTKYFIQPQTEKEEISDDTDRSN